MQTKIGSLLEQFCNIGSGYIISLLVWLYVIIPVFEIDTHLSENIMITGIFCIVSIIRGYCWRRLFNYFTIKSQEDVKA